MSEITQLYPKRFFHYFNEIAKIPHGSKNTKSISDYLVAFAKEHSLEYCQDESNNVIIIKEATPGYETCEPIILQGHMDMVCEKEKDCTIDFEKDGLSLYVDGDFLKAKGTTLGGDDGVAVCYALALLESKELAHPRLEVVITVDEEIGMLGAEILDVSMLKGHTMLNIDSDEEGHFLTSCAGGLSVNGTIPVQWINQSGLKCTLSVTGLFGGHSGAEIHKERGNADILMGRVLNCLGKETPFGLISLMGGLKDNAIPRECTAELLLPTKNLELAKACLQEVEQVCQKELSLSDSNFKLQFEVEKETEAKILDFASLNKIIYYLRSIPNGVQHMSQAMPGLVETSLNLGIMELKEDALYLVHSLRSSVESRKMELLEKVVMCLDMVGGEAVVEGNYPAWEYKNESPLREKIAVLYEEMFGEKPLFEALHAGLECGLLSDKIPDLDCVSFGPNNYDIHTPMERLSISSTAKIWDFLVEFLKRCK